MLPTEALPQDWRMYYHNCWMEHKKHGIGLVSVLGDSFYFYTFPEDTQEEEPLKVRAADLDMWWPRPGAYNTPNGAVFIARRSTRTMRKSATANEHYFCQWGHIPNGLVKMMLLMRRGPEYVDVPMALRAMKTGLSRSVAISRDIILFQRTEGEPVTAWFYGAEVGVVDEDGEFQPYLDNPLSRRVSNRIIRQGGL